MQVVNIFKSYLAQSSSIRDPRLLLHWWPRPLSVGSRFHETRVPWLERSPHRWRPLSHGPDSWGSRKPTQSSPLGSHSPSDLEISNMYYVKDDSLIALFMWGDETRHEDKTFWIFSYICPPGSQQSWKKYVPPSSYAVSWICVGIESRLLHYLVMNE